MLPNPSIKIISFLCIIPFWINCQQQDSVDTISNSTTTTRHIESSSLHHIKNTRRISSNHFSDIVVDDNGNSYIATFEKKIDNQDYISIIKMDPEGRMEWDLGNESLGRATAISIDSQNHIWVTGYFEDRLEINGKHTNNIPGHRLFVARIHPNGQCIVLKHSLGAQGFNIHVNHTGQVLVSGVFHQKMILDDCTLQHSSSDTFIALLDSNGNCIQIEPIQGTIQRIESAPDGHFYISGHFHEAFVFRDMEAQTSGPLDQDAFLFQYHKQNGNGWLRTFGNRGILKDGYRTSESATDMVVDENGIYLITIEDSNIPYNSPIQKMQWYHYTWDGKQINTSTIAEPISYKSIGLIEKDEKGHFWIAGKSDYSLKVGADILTQYQEHTAFLLELDKNLELIYYELPQYTDIALFRGIRCQNSKVYLSGHFKGQLKLKKDTIQNNGEHGLFLYFIQ